MSDAIKGFGDRVHVSASFMFGGGGYDLDNESETENGVSARVGYDLIDGNLILTPFGSLTYSRVSADKYKVVSGRFVPDDKNFPLEQPARRSETYHAAETETDRVIAGGGLAVGWWFDFYNTGYDKYDNLGSGIGVQGIFEIGREYLMGHSVQEHFPDRTVDMPSSDETTAMRAGVEGLILPFGFGDRDSKVGLGLLVGLYWHHKLHPIARENSHGAEANFGIAATF